MRHMATDADIDRHDERLLVTVNEACERLQVSRDTLYTLMRQGRLRYLQLGGMRRIPVTELEAFIASELHEADGPDVA
jgi:excisionase family DNA binding protein